jgi:NAD(P)-dependent dehydrogenase (short-subunit alcohol dehydrogenase family)
LELASNKELEGKVAIVTGGNSGIGKAISELFASEGAKVMITDLEDSGVTKGIEARGGTARFHRTDVRSLEQVRKLIDQTISEFGKIDLLINDAGVEQNRPVIETSEEEWDKILDTNLKGVFLTSKFVFPYLTKSKHGAIVNIASQLAQAALPGRAAYCASKAGVVMLTKVLAVEYSSYGVRVNCVSPGPIQTPMLDRTNELNKDPAEARRVLISKVPLGRTGEAGEIAQAVLYLVSSRSSYVTGHNLVVDGGYTVS